MSLHRTQRGSTWLPSVHLHPPPRPCCPAGPPSWQSEDKSVVIWRCDDWSVQARVVGPYNRLVTSTFFMRMSWSPDGTYLATGGRLWGAGGGGGGGGVCVRVRGDVREGCAGKRLLCRDSRGCSSREQHLVASLLRFREGGMGWRQGSARPSCS